MREEGVSGHLDSYGLTILPYIDGEYFADGACVGPFEGAREPGEVVHPSERCGGLDHPTNIKGPSQIEGRASAVRRPRCTAVDGVDVRPCGGAPSRVEGVGNSMGLLHGNIVGQVAVERSDDDFGRVAGFRIEGDYLSHGMDARVGASRGLDSDGLAGEAMYSCFDFLLYRSRVLLILESAVSRPVILDDECVPQCTAYAPRKPYAALLHEFQAGHRGGVAFAGAHLDDARVASGAFVEAGADLVEELGDDLFVGEE